MHSGHVRAEAARVTPNRIRETANEQVLMAAYADGDKSAFAPLFDALAPRLLAFFLRAVRDREVAEDLLQITFERVHAARKRYERGSPVRPWLFTIAARVRIDELRRRYRVAASTDEDLDRLPDSTVGLDDDVRLDQLARDEAVRVAIDALPPSQRVVVHLHRFEGMTFGEIGRVLNVQEGAVRLRAFRAYENLRTRLAPLMKEGAS